MKYTNQLVKLGFTENEAIVYLASLRVGNARVSRIAEEAKLPKSTTKDTLSSLHERGFVSRYKHKNRFHFTPSDPSSISVWLDRNKTLIDDLLPKLKLTQFSAENQPTVRSFYDETGFRVVESEIISEAKEILLITPAHDLDQLLPDHFPGFMIRRLKHNIRARILIEESPIADKVKGFDLIAQHETRAIKPPIPFESIMLIWGKKIATVSLDNKVSIVVLEDKNINQMITSLFDLLWNNASEK
ncbi:helix-turn-helix domain-containing protein [Candidatus Nomurabacteria bacterium]|nr:helix-turn-helix domain-containing protein [Candidatus Kaiserbacteria bacterium]MCB9813831.1 helix-turn-helix domain-containing protein [Candidatus Nomurabacteria bacterium]